MGGQQERLNTVPHLQNRDVTDWIWHIVGFQQMGIILKQVFIWGNGQPGIGTDTFEGQFGSEFQNLKCVYSSEILAHVHKEAGIFSLQCLK